MKKWKKPQVNILGLDATKDDKENKLAWVYECQGCYHTYSALCEKPEKCIRCGSTDIEYKCWTANGWVSTLPDFSETFPSVNES